MGTPRLAAALCALALASLAALTAGTAGAAFTAVSTNPASSLAADVLDAPGAFTASRSCTASGAQLRSVSQSTGTSGTISVPLPAGVVAGDVIVGIVVHSTKATPPAASPGDGWQVATGGNFGVGGSSFFGSKLATGTEPAAYTFTGLTAGSAAAAVVLAYSGGAWNYPSHGISFGEGTVVSAQGTTVTEQTRMLTAFFADDYDGVVSLPAGTTERARLVTGGADSVALLVTDRLVPAAGTLDATVATLGEARSNQGFSLPIQPGAGPSPVTLTWTATPDFYASGYEGFRSDFLGYVVFGSGRTVTSYVDPSLGAAGATYSLRSYAGSWRSGWVTTSLLPC